MAPRITVLLLAAAAAGAAAPAAVPAPAPMKARHSVTTSPAVLAFPLRSVRLLDGPFKAAQEVDRAYLLRLDPDRLLAWFRKEAGLPAIAKPYGGWEVGGVAGHTAGHYLSAASLMHAATGDAELLRRVHHMVSEIAACQAANGNGYAGAIPDGKAIFAEIAQGKPVRGQVPWYTVHKLLGGLRDAHANCGSVQALQIWTALVEWIGATVGALDDRQMEAMLDTEHGGMAETIADLYAITHDPRHLALARRFTHHRFFDPFSHGRDNLDNIHANTQIPKFVGYERIHSVGGGDAYHTAAAAFWNSVVRNRTWANGGNSMYEAFFPASRTAWAVEQSGGPETCNTYNMLRLTDLLFRNSASMELADYAERALWNHILASIDPVHGGLAYYSAVRPGHYRVYSSDFDDFWCCVGTGIENHARYGEAIYYHRDSTLYVNQYIASRLEWSEKGLEATLETRFPDERGVRIGFRCARPVAMTLRLRLPAWAQASAMRVRVNGKPVDAPARDGAFAITRTWRTGDTVALALPARLRLEPLAGSPRHVAVCYGPILLAGRAGTAGLQGVDFNRGGPAADRLIPVHDAPTVVGTGPGLLSAMRRCAGPHLAFRTGAATTPTDVRLEPAFRVHFERYNVYWRLLTRAQIDAEKVDLERKAQAKRDLDARSVDVVQIGDAASEKQHDLQGEDMASMPFNERNWRHGKWLSYVMRVLPDQPVDILATYWGSDNGPREFDIVVDGVVIATQQLRSPKPDEFIDIPYHVPVELTRGKSTVCVKFQAHPGNLAGGVFGLRIVHPAGKP